MKIDASTTAPASLKGDILPAEAPAPAVAEVEPVFETVEVDIGDVSVDFDLPVGFTTMDMNEAMAKFRDTDQFKSLIDNDTGAPAAVRAYVGSTQNSQDALATLKRYYPDAIPWGDDNFLFTDGATGKPTVFNPEGMDWGDVAGFSRDLSGGLGGTLGAIGGAIGGTPAAGVGAIPGVVVGAGVGTGLGYELFDFTMRLFDRTQDSRSETKKFIDRGTNIMGGMVGERIGQVVIDAAPAAARALGKTDAARILARQLDKFGIEKSAGMLSTADGAGGPVSMVENAAQQTTGGKGLIQQAQRIIQQVEDATTNFITRRLDPSMAGARSNAEIGDVMKNASTEALERFTLQQEAAYDVALTPFRDAMVPLDGVKAFMRQMQQRIAEAPATRANEMSSVMKELSGLLNDANASGHALPLQVLRDKRTEIFRKFNDMATPSDVFEMKLREVLKDDIAATIERLSPGAASALREADKATAIFKQTLEKMLKKTAETDNVDQVFRNMLSGGRTNSRLVERMANEFTSEEWDIVSAGMIHRLGRVGGAVDAPFSPATFVTNYSKMTPEAKAVLYKNQPDLASATDELIDIMKGIGANKRFANSSNTSGNSFVHTMMATLATAGTASATGIGDVATNVALGSAAITAQHLTGAGAGKLLMSKAFVKWLSEPVTQSSRYTIAQHFIKLNVIAQTNPQLREHINGFVKTFRSIHGIQSEQNK